MSALNTCNQLAFLRLPDSRKPMPLLPIDCSERDVVSPEYVHNEGGLLHSNSIVKVRIEGLGHDLANKAYAIVPYFTQNMCS